MDFNVIKKWNKKLNLWTGVISFTFLTVALIIIFALTSFEIKIRVIVAIQFLVNNLFLWILIVLINLSPTIFKFLFRITTYRHPQTKTREKSEFTLIKSIHLLIFFLCLIIWLSEVSSFMLITESWVLALQKYWWICLILMIFNFTLLYLNFFMGQYLYNHQPEIKKELDKK